MEGSSNTEFQKLLANLMGSKPKSVLDEIIQG
jgi:hypothetical protein